MMNLPTIKLVDLPLPGNINIFHTTITKNKT